MWIILYLLTENIKTCVATKFGLTEEMLTSDNRKIFIEARFIDELL